MSKDKIGVQLLIAVFGDKDQRYRQEQAFSERSEKLIAQKKVITVLFSKCKFW